MQAEISTLHKEVEDLKRRVSDIEDKLNDDSSVEISTGIREFVGEFDPDSHTERSLAICYFLEAHRDQDTFKVDDVRDGYQECRVQQPANVRDVLQRMEKRGWLLRAGEEDNYQLRRLTGDALEYVEERIDNES